ncbi:hypothetical protein Q7P37_011582 [Cladosporium fusiforme]
MQHTTFEEISRCDKIHYNLADGDVACIETAEVHRDETSLAGLRVGFFCLLRLRTLSVGKEAQEWRRCPGLFLASLLRAAIFSYPGAGRVGYCMDTYSTAILLERAIIEVRKRAGAFHPVRSSRRGAPPLRLLFARWLCYRSEAVSRLPCGGEESASSGVGWDGQSCRAPPGGGGGMDQSWSPRSCLRACAETGPYIQTYMPYGMYGCYDAIAAMAGAASAPASPAVARASVGPRGQCRPSLSVELALRSSPAAARDGVQRLSVYPPGIPMAAALLPSGSAHRAQSLPAENDRPQSLANSFLAPVAAPLDNLRQPGQPPSPMARPVAR